jgi:hypothetical protein
MSMAVTPPAEQTLIRCGHCGHILAAEVAGLTVIRRGNPRGKPYEWTGFAVSIRCDACGCSWTNPHCSLPQAA